MAEKMTRRRFLGLIGAGIAAPIAAKVPPGEAVGADFAPKPDHTGYIEVEVGGNRWKVPYFVS